MKKNITLILTIWILGIGTGFAQSDLPFFEQIAFEYYGNEILKKHPLKKRINVYRYYSDFQNAGSDISYARCFKKEVKKEDVEKIDEDVYGQFSIDSDKFEMDLSRIDKKKFKIRNNGRGNYPKLFFSYPMVSKNQPKRYFVNVSEMYKYRVNTYHLEINADGQVIDWCNSYSETIITY